MGQVGTSSRNPAVQDPYDSGDKLLSRQLSCRSECESTACQFGLDAVHKLESLKGAGTSALSILVTMQLQQSVRLPTLPASAQKCLPLARMASSRRTCGRRVCVVPQALNKTELVGAVHKQCPDLTQAAVSDVVTALLDTVVKTVAAGDTVSVLGFGKFEMRCDDLEASVLHQACTATTKQRLVWHCTAALLPVLLLVQGSGKQGQDETLGMEHHLKFLPAKLQSLLLARASKTQSQARLQQQRQQQRRQQAVEQRLLVD